MDELVGLIIAVFIANYKAEEHPYLTCCVKAFLIALILLLFWMVQDFMNNAFTLERTMFSLKIVIGLWLALSLFLMFVELVFSDRK